MTGEEPDKKLFVIVITIIEGSCANIYRPKGSKSPPGGLFRKLIGIFASEQISLVVVEIFPRKN